MPQVAAVLGTQILGTTIGSILANVAVAYVAGKVLAPSKPTSKGKGGLKQMVRGAIEPRKICYGEGYTSGPLAYAAVSGDSSGKINKYLHLIVVLATHPIESIDTLYIDEEDYSLISRPFFKPKLNLANTEDRLNSYILKNLKGWDQKEQYEGLIRVIPVTGKWMYNVSGTTDQDILDDYTRWQDVKNSIGGEWTEDHRLDRCAFVYCRFEYDSEIWSNIPNIYTKIKGANLYNPLADQDFQVSPYMGTVFENRGSYTGGLTYKVGDLVTDNSTQYVCTQPHTAPSTLNINLWEETHANLRNNPQLWTYSRNWALCSLDYLLNKRYGLGVKTSGILNEVDWLTLLETIRDSYDGGYLDSSRSTIPASRLAGPNNVSTYPKFRVDGILETSNTPIDNLETLFTAANGEMAYSQGKHFLKAGIYSEPSVNPASFPDTVVDESYLADSALTLTTSVPNSAIFNSVNGVYISKEKGEPVEMAPLFIEEYIANDGQEYIEDRDYPVTSYEEVARNLAKQSLEESRHGKNLTLSCNIKILKYKVGDVVPFSNNVLGFTNTEYASIKYAPSSIPKLFKIISMSVKEGLNVDVGLQEITYVPYDPNSVLTGETPDSELLATNPNTIVGVPSIGVDDLGEFYAKYDLGTATNVHYVDLSWRGPDGVDNSQFGYSQLDRYEVKYCKIGNHLTNGGTLNTGGSLSGATITVNIVGNTITSANIVNGGYGYWRDGYLEIQTNLPSGEEDAALLEYIVDGSGAINTISIINGGSGYTNGTGVNISSDLPSTYIANPDEDGDLINDWRILSIPANKRRIEQPPRTLRLDEQLGDYIFAVRSVLGWKKSEWAIITKSKSGNEIVYGVPTAITAAYSYGDETHVYAQFDLTNSLGEDNLSYIEWVIGDYQFDINQYPIGQFPAISYKSYLPLPSNWAEFDVEGKILTPISSIGLITSAYGNNAVAWRTFWLYARVVNTGGVASPWYPSSLGPRRGIPTGLGRGDAQNLLPLPSDYTTQPTVSSPDVTPITDTGAGGGPYPEEESGITPTAPKDDGGGDPDSNTGVYSIRDSNPLDELDEY